MAILRRFCTEKAIVRAFSFFLLCLPISIALINIAFYLLTALIIGNLLWDRTWVKHWKQAELFWIGLIFCLVQVASVLLSPYSKSSLGELREVIHPLLILTWVLKFSGARELLIAFRKRLWLLSLSISIVTIYVIFQHFTGIDWAHGLHAHLHVGRTIAHRFRVSGFFGHPLTFAYLYLMLLPLCFAPAMEAKGIGARLLWSLPIFFCATCIYLSLSRTALVVLAVELAFLLMFLPWRLKLSLLGLTVALIIFVYTVHPPFRERVKQMNPQVAGHNEFDRLIFWKVHFMIFKDHPWLGAGANCSRYLQTTYYKKIKKGAFPRKYSAHNLYLQFLSDSGVLGLLSFLLVMAGWLARLLKNLGSFSLLWRWHQVPSVDRLSLLIFCMYIGLLLGSITQNTLKDSAVAIVFWSFYALMPRVAEDIS